jgi:hypothetical protein
MNTNKANGRVCRRVRGLGFGASLIAILCINGLFSASCAYTEEQQYRANQRNGTWKAEFLDWRHGCLQAGGIVIVDSSTDSDGVPPPASYYSCTAMVKRSY